jgi:hypothetical protein
VLKESSAMSYLQQDVAETVLSWLRPGGAGEAAGQTAAWGPAEWAEARQAALVHGVTPLLAARLEGSAAWGALAPELRAYCVEQRSLNGRRVELMRADLAGIVRAAAQEGVRVLPLKGAALVERYYAEPGLRPMADIDLLVRPEELPRLDRALAGLGFQALEETARHRAYGRGAPVVVSWDHEHPDNPRGVEVHTRVGEQLRAISYDITDSLWAGASQAAFDGGPGMLPAPAGLLHHLLIHTCHNVINRRLRLIQLYDIALVAPAVSAAAWVELSGAALAAGEARLLYAPLALAEGFFGPLAPGEARERLAAAAPPALRQLLSRLTPNAVSLCEPSEASPRFKLAWYRPGGEWLGAVLRVLMPAPAELRQRYPIADGLPRAYLRHVRQTAGWALRSALGRARRTQAGG